ncbi:MAG TPA: hypothetical protein VIK95_09795 [Egibacteraceae bacterium]
MATPSPSLRVHLACGCDVTLVGAEAAAVIADTVGFASARCPVHSRDPRDYWTVSP